MGVIQVLIILATIAIVVIAPCTAILVSERATGWWKGYKRCVSNACYCNRRRKVSSVADQPSSDTPANSIVDSERGTTVEESIINKEQLK